MNPGKLNHRLKFSLQVSDINDSGGATVTTIPVVISDTVPTDTTWGSLEPIKQWEQVRLEGFATVLDSDRVAIIRYRKSVTITKNMIFEDLNNPGAEYTIHSILPYQPGSKSTFQNTDQQVYKDQVYVFILAKLRQ
jgi:hypothetical protein